MTVKKSTFYLTGADIMLFVGGSTSSPATSPSRAAMWDHFHFPLVVPLAYLLPDMILLKLLSDTLNSVHASFAVPLFIYFHLRHNHRHLLVVWWDYS